MELIGQIGERKFFYCHIRSDKDWFEKILFQNWIAFTVADTEDEDLLYDMTRLCLDGGACYTCSAGELASITEDYFDEEIVFREIENAKETGIEEDYEYTPMTSFHRDFDGGFWFAATTAKQIINDKYVISKEVVCVDCTPNKVRGHLINLVAKISKGWFPPDDEKKKPTYDKGIIN